MSIKEGIFVGMVLVAVFLGMVGNVGAYIELGDIDICIENRNGYVEFRSTEDFNETGTLRIGIDNLVILEQEIIAETVLFHGFYVHPREEVKFNLNMTEGIHYIYVDIVTAQYLEIAEIEYQIEGEIEEEEVEEEEPAEEIDWLPCP